MIKIGRLSRKFKLIQKLKKNKDFIVDKNKVLMSFDNVSIDELFKNDKKYDDIILKAYLKEDKELKC